MKGILILARMTFREAIRRKIVLAGLVLGVCFLIVFSVGFAIITNEIEHTLGNVNSINAEQGINRIQRVEGTNMLMLSGLYAVTFLSIAMGALLGADTLAGEISSGTIQTIVTKPIRRSAVVFGKWLGYAGLLGLYLLLMAAGTMLSVWLQSGYSAPHWLAGLALIYLETLLVMTIAFLCSSAISALATGGVVFGLYGLSFIGGWIEQFGAILHNQTAVKVGIVTSLIVPSEALWHRAAYEMQSPIAGVLGMSPFGTASVPSPLMVVYAGIYLLLALWMTVRVFRKRDL